MKTQNLKSFPDLRLCATARLMTISIAAALLSLGWLLPSSGQAPMKPQYDVIDLSPLGGTFTESLVQSLNNYGESSGRSYNADNSILHSLVWSRKGAPMFLKGGESAIALNDAGNRVGAGARPNGQYRALFWPQGSKEPTTLRGRPTYSCNALAINSSDNIVGNFFNDDYTFFRAFYWPTPQSKPVLLPALPGDLVQTGLTSRHCLNDVGQIVGGANDVAYTVLRATYWANSQTVPVDLGSIGDFADSFAEAINNSGQIVGAAAPTPDFSVSRAVYWANGNSAGIDLGPLDEDLTNSEAQGINDEGQIVGEAFNADFSTERAVLWASPSDPAVDLNDLIPADSGWILVQAIAINSSGVIAGDGLIDGQSHGFLLIPRRP